MANALGHPKRRVILRALMEEDQSPRSPVELTELLGLTFSTVNYHVRILAREGALELTSTKETRGSMKHFYAPGDLVKNNHDYVVATLADIAAEDESNSDE